MREPAAASWYAWQVLTRRRGGPTPKPSMTDRRFITYEEMLGVVKSLGYHK